MKFTNYWLPLVWILISGVFSSLFLYRYETTSYGQEHKKWPISFVVLIIIPLIFWTAIRPNFIDTFSYRAVLNTMDTGLTGFSAYMLTVTKDKWFYAVLYILNWITGGNDVLAFALLAIFHFTILAYVFYEFSCDYWLSLFIFVASTEYFSWTWNGIRQFTAVVIILAGFKLILNKKYIPAIIVIIIAAQFHQSALLMIPVLFIVQGDAWNFRTIICIVGAIGVLLFVDRFTDFLQVALEDTQYTNVVNDYMSMNDNGTSPLRVLVYSIPTILSVIGRKHIKYANSNLLNVCVNASILSLVLYLVSMVTSGIFLGRLPIYVSLLSTSILLPWEINNLFTKKSSQIVKYVLILFYIIFYYYQCHVAWGVL